MKIPCKWDEDLSLNQVLQFLGLTTVPLHSGRKYIMRGDVEVVRGDCADIWMWVCSLEEVHDDGCRSCFDPDEPEGKSLCSNCHRIIGACFFADNVCNDCWVSENQIALL